MSAVLGAFSERGPVADVAAAVSVRTFPSVAVLCAPARRRAAGAAIALALARAAGAPGALVAAVGVAEQASGALVVAPAARRAASRLREAGFGAFPRGRLVWLGDRRAGVDEHNGGDPAELAAALCAEVARAAARAGLPAVTVLPLPRTAALDRVIAWHDAVVAVPEPGTSRELVDLGLASVADLGVAVASAEPPSRIAASLALLGVTPPASASAAVARLDLAGDRVDGRRR